MLVLASASPRRRELLTQAGYSFEVHPADIPEDPSPTKTPSPTSPASPAKKPKPSLLNSPPKA
jgi:predicted house-cleaning NTP pyrophosphatase (Maf/HAM1 superfamily)